MNDTQISTIPVAPGQLTDSMSLVRGTALDGCITLEASDDGLPVFVPRWPSLSSGERLLWRLLAWLNGQDERPSDDDLKAGLSPDQWPAAAAAITAGTGVRSLLDGAVA